MLLSASTLLCVYLLLLPPDTDTLPGPVHAATRPGRRSGRHYMPFHHVPFGPFATELEVLLHASEQHGLPDLRTFHDTLDRLPDLDAALVPLDRYFGSDGALSVRERLVYLFAMLDRSPKDGGISHAELEAWLHRQAAERLGALTRREMEKHDKDGDGAVTLHEYLGVDPDQDIDWSNTEHGKPGWWQHKFASADRDESGALDTVEFNDFLHPEDSGQEKVHLWILKDKLSEMDRDRDGRLSLGEFMDQSHRIDHISVAQHDGGHDFGRAEAEKRFRELDADMDNYLTVEEARPVIQSLLAGEFSYATSHAKLLMKADDDGDSKLSLEEMLNHYMSFYNIVYMDDHFDYDDADSDFHDELR